MAWNTLSANTGRTSGKIMGFRLYFLGNRYRKNIPVITEILNLSAATECFIWFVYIGRKTWTFFSCSAASTTGCILYIKNICAVCLHGSVWCQRGKKKMSRSFRSLLSCLCRSSVCYFCFLLEEKKKKTVTPQMHCWPCWAFLLFFLSLSLSVQLWRKTEKTFSPEFIFLFTGHSLLHPDTWILNLHRNSVPTAWRKLIFAELRKKWHLKVMYKG